MSRDDQLPLEGFSDDAETIDEAPSPPRPEWEPTVDQSEQGVDDAKPAEAPAPEAGGTPAPLVDESPLLPADKASGEHEERWETLAPEVNEPTSEPAPTELEPQAPSEPVLVEPDPASPVGPLTEGVPAISTALYFLTNRMNLNGVLGSRLIAPREAHAKYYVDLLERVPGWVPLLTQRPPQALIDAVTKERGAGTPVLIEFPLSMAKEAELNAPVAYVPAVALSQAVAIHFREERDLREHRARGYKNIHPHDGLLKVTPELFASDAVGEVVLTPPANPSQVSWTRIDRIRGAINGALAAAQSGEQLAVVAAFLGAVKLPASVSLPDWISWREVDDHRAPDNPLAPDGVPDHVGFRAVYGVLGEQDASDAWSPNAVLHSVASRIQGAGLKADLVDVLIRNLQRVRSIVNVEVDFEPFRPTARALVSAKALLLVLLRSELEELLAWPDEQTGADDLTRVTAAVLAGRLRGLARESTTLRSLAFDDLTAAWAVRVARGDATALGKVQFAATTRGTSLKLDGVELSTQDALLPDPVTKYQKLADAKKEAVRIAVARAVGWPVTHHLTVPAGATTSEESGVITILTPGEVELSVSVDEDEFVSKLGALTGQGKRKALAAFDLRNR